MSNGFVANGLVVPSTRRLDGLNGHGEPYESDGPRRSDLEAHSTGDVRLFPEDYPSVMHVSSKKGRGWDLVGAQAGLSEDP